MFFGSGALLNSLNGRLEQAFLGLSVVQRSNLFAIAPRRTHIRTMTNPIKAQVARASVGAAAPMRWLVPPLLVPILLTIMIGARAIYLAYPL